MSADEMVLLAEGEVPECLRFYFAPDGIWVSGGIGFPELPSASICKKAQELLDSKEVNVLKVGPSCKSLMLWRWAPSICFSRLDLQTGQELIFESVYEAIENVEKFHSAVGFQGHFVAGGEWMPYWVYDSGGRVLASGTNLAYATGYSTLEPPLSGPPMWDNWHPGHFAGGVDTFAVSGVGSPFFDVYTFEGKFVRRINPIEQLPEDEYLQRRARERKHPDTPQGIYVTWNLLFDRRGNLWATAFQRFLVYSPEGDLLWKGDPPREHYNSNHWWLDQNGFAWFFYSDDRYAVCAIEEFGW